MALILQQAAPLKPEIALAQAISNFESSLNQRQKIDFRDFRTVALRSAPSAEDVMRLTADINSQMQTSSAASRCFGTRFTSFLHSVQRYAALGDVVVGGSQNIVACGVWALVRMTIEICIGLGSYIDKVSHFFMVVGRSAPRYESMALLYRRSRRLGQYLADYYKVVVETCQSFLLFSRKSMIGQFAASLGDSKIQDAQSGLEKWSNLIREEVAFLNSETIEDEAQENRRFRELMGKGHSWRQRERMILKRLKLLDSLSDIEHEPPYRQARKAGCSTTFQHDVTYKGWKKSKGPASLVLTGKLGSGKTVTTANVVEDLYLSDPSPVVAYYFCRHDDVHGLTARAIIGSLSRQLVTQYFNDSLLADIIDGPSPMSLTIQDAIQVVMKAASSDSRAYFVLDGIDECPVYEAEETMKALRKFQNQMGLLVFVSVRSGGRYPSHLFDPLLNLATLSTPKDNPDITKFVELELQRRIESSQLILGDATLILDIRDTLLNGAEGMFLWVVLQISCLCNETSDMAIREALKDLPQDLSTLFTRILERSQRSSKSYQGRILKLITAAFRPLNVDELRDILSITPGDVDWNPEAFVNNIYSALACCGGLVTVDEDDLSVRLIHQSVMQFLLTDSPKNSVDVPGWHFTLEEAQQYMGRSLVTYLNFPIFGTQLSSCVAQKIPVGNVPSHVIKDTLTESRVIRELALKLLKSTSSTSGFDADNILMEAESKRNRPDSTTTACALEPYASRYWLEHTPWIDEESEFYHVWIRLLKNPRFNQLHWADISLSKGDSAVQRHMGRSWNLSPRVTWAIIHGHIPLLRYEIKGGKWYMAFGSVVPYLEKCLACDSKPKITAAMCTYLLPLVALFGSQALLRWLLSMGASPPLDVQHGFPASLSDRDYNIAKAILSQRGQDHSIMNLRPMIQGAILRQDGLMISKLGKFPRLVLDFPLAFPESPLASGQPESIRATYYLLQMNPLFRDYQAHEVLSSIYRMFQLVNPGVFNPVDAVLGAIHRSLPFYAYESFIQEIIKQSCTLTDSGLIQSLAKFLGQSIDTNIILSALIDAFSSNLDTRRHVLLQVCSYFEIPIEAISCRKYLECFMRCLHLRDWEFAELLVERIRPADVEKLLKKLDFVKDSIRFKICDSDTELPELFQWLVSKLPELSDWSVWPTVLSYRPRSIADSHDWKNALEEELKYNQSIDLAKDANNMELDSYANQGAHKALGFHRRYLTMKMISFSLPTSTHKFITKVLLEIGVEQEFSSFCEILRALKTINVLLEMGDDYIGDSVSFGTVEALMRNFVKIVKRKEQPVPEDCRKSFVTGRIGETLIMILRTVKNRGHPDSRDICEKLLRKLYGYIDELTLVRKDLGGQLRATIDHYIDY